MSLQPGQLNHVLTNQGISGGFGTSTTYTCVQVYSSGNALYRMTTDVSSGSTVHDILYKPTGWEDSGSSDPNKFRSGSSSSDPVITPSATATELYLFTSTTFMTALNTGYTSSGGGPGTMSNSGSLQKVGLNLVWTISSLSQDGDYVITESSDGGSSFSVKTTIVIPNLAGTRTGNVSSWNDFYMYKFYDPLENLLGSYSPGRKKVSRNFW